MVAAPRGSATMPCTRLLVLLLSRSATAQLSSLVANHSGPCLVNTVTNCVCSSNIDVGECDASSAATVSGEYGSYESCQVDFTRDVTLAVHLLETEYSGSCAYDYVSVDDWPYKYCTGGDDGDDLDGKTTSTLQFDSDGSVQDYGFIICFS